VRIPVCDRAELRGDRPVSRRPGLPVAREQLRRVRDDVRLGRAHARAPAHANRWATVGAVPPGSPRSSGCAKWSQRTFTCVTSSAARLSSVVRMSDGYTEQSPVYSITSVGIVMPLRLRSSAALDETPDHVDSHASGVARRPKPPTLKLVISGLR